MSRSLMALAALGTLALSACGSSQAPADTADSAPAPIPAEAPAQEAAASPAASGSAVVVDEASKAFIAALTPREVGLALLSCVRPIDSAKPNKHLFDAELAAQLDATSYLSHGKIITSIEGMTIKEARAIMDASPSFQSNGPAPTADQITGLKQCLVLAAYYTAEQAKAQ